ncbi:MAG TPA: response regulator [Candidatus Acidoferrum sp.]|jgi:CheY-like chemotaxis protein
MTGTSRLPKILLIDSNVYFSKRLSDALKKEGFQVLASTQPAFALTTLEYDTPTAVVCATNMRDMGALEIANIIKADPKNANLPIIALGDGSQRALMEAFQAGCDDYIDRGRQPAVIASHIRNIIVSKSEGFQPTQMLAQADTSLSGSLTHHDLPGVLQMLGQARQTGALHINAGATDAVLFFDAGSINHAECGSLFGDEAVIHIVKSCIHGGEGVYKFVYGATTPRTTVLRSATDLMLDAMREYDESANAFDNEPQASRAGLDELLEPNPLVSDLSQQTPEEYSTVIETGETPPETPSINGELQSDFVGTDEASSAEQPAIAMESDQPEPEDAPSVSEASLVEAQPSEFEVAASDEDSATGYTETSPQPNEEHSETAIVLAHEEEVSLLEKILTELAARHIAEEHPADLADKEAQ